MYKSVLKIVSALLLAAGLSTNSAAVIVYDNGGPGGVNGSLLSVSPTGAPVLAADDFTLTQALQLTDAHFWTIEDPAGSWDGTVFAAIIADDGVNGPNVPGTVIAGGPAININKVPTGNVVPISGTNFIEYQYDIDFAVPVDLMPGTYWFGLFLGFGSTGINWEFTTGVTGNPLAVRLITNQIWFQGNADAAFYLTGVPSPAVPALLAIGLLFPLLRASRRRGQVFRG